jgi:hypothetical protein
MTFDMTDFYTLNQMDNLSQYISVRSLMEFGEIVDSALPVNQNDKQLAVVICSGFYGGSIFSYLLCKIL